MIILNKKRIIITLLIVMIAGLFQLNIANAINCPSEPPGIAWRQKEITNSYITAEGCTVNVAINWCYGIGTNGLHYVSFNDIKICVTGCDPKKINPEDYYTTETIDNSLIDFSNDSLIVANFLGGDGIPPCPGFLCYLQAYDAICYSGWVLDDFGCWKMRLCGYDNSIMRRCASEIHICYDTATGKTIVERVGTTTPLPCPSENCRYKCF